MTRDISRLRMFAGPNGSGKSTIKADLLEGWFGYYLNPDDMEKTIRQQHFFDLGQFSFTTTRQEILDFFSQSDFLATAGLIPAAKQLTFIDGKLDFSAVPVNSYLASVLADFVRKKFLTSSTSFTFETVMSSRDKVDFLKLAQVAGFRTYLYYVSTEDPRINLERVRYRVQNGGHTVPEDKIISRYYRSLDLLAEAVAYTNRAYIFDNSGSQRRLVAEVSDGTVIQTRTNAIPDWFKTYLWDKTASPDHLPG
jgi:predicted ABC-type ATPase